MLFSNGCFVLDKRDLKVYFVNEYGERYEPDVKYAYTQGKYQKFLIHFFVNNKKIQAKKLIANLIKENKLENKKNEIMFNFKSRCIDQKTDPQSYKKKKFVFFEKENTHSFEGGYLFNSTIVRAKNVYKML